MFGRINKLFHYIDRCINKNMIVRINKSNDNDILKIVGYHEKVKKVTIFLFVIIVPMKIWPINPIHLQYVQIFFQRMAIYYKLGST